ncbi:MAG: response regulator transcription factor [Thermodesulfovibrionales bacterium]
MYRILIADDHPIVLKGLKQILEESGIVRRITQVNSGEEVLATIKENNFDMVLLDISMSGINGIETLEEVKKLKPSLPVLILSMYPEKDYALRAIKAGASGYLTKKSAPAELANAISKIARGGRYISPVLADLIASTLTASSDTPPHERLSNREFQVLRMIASGKSLKEIGGEISLSPKTIGTFRTRILQKLNLTGNAELVRYALKHELFELPPE